MAPSPRSSVSSVRLGAVRIETLHLTQPIPPTPVNRLIVHQSAALASDVIFSGHAARMHLALTWIVRTHGTIVFNETQVHTVSWNGMTSRRFALPYAPCVAGEYAVTFRLAGGVFPVKQEVRAFRVLDVGGRVGDTLQASGNGDVTLLHTSRTQQLQYAPGTPYITPRHGDDFLITSWTIMNRTSSPVIIPIPIVVSGGIPRRALHLGGVPYISPLAPKTSKSLEWAFEVPKGDRNIRIDYATKHSVCGGKLTWQL
jgi:hypothetical protein